MEKKRFFNFKNLFLISFLAVAGIFSAGAFVVNNKSANLTHKADAYDSVTYDGTHYVYLNLGSIDWWNDEAKLWVYATNDSSNSTAAMSQINGGRYYKAKIPSGTWTKIIFVRCNNSSTFDWDNKWNQTQDLQAPVLVNTNCYVLTDWNLGNATTYYDAADSDGWYLVGNDKFRESVGTSGQDYKYTSGYKMTPDDSGDNQAYVLGITLKTGTAFKARWWSGDNGGWCSSTSYDTSEGATGYSQDGDGNLTISSTRKYDIYYQNGGNLYITNTKHTVTFNANGHGTAPSPYTGAVNGSVISAPTAPTATGYTFGGWYKESGCSNVWNFSTDVVTEDTTLFAKWTVKTYTVTKGTQTNGALTVASLGTYGTGLSISWAPEGAAGYTYTFVSVTVKNGATTLATYTSGTSATYTMSGTYYSSVTINLTYTKTANTYTVSYNNGGHGTAPSSSSATYGDSFTTASAITGVDGYSFDHWSGSNGNNYNADQSYTYSVVGNLTLTAVWNTNVYTITLDNLDATTPGTETIYEKYGVGYYSDLGATSPITKITIPTKVNSTGLEAVFGGYFTEQGGNGTQVIAANGDILATSTSFLSTTTLYAKWTVTFTFDPNEYQGGSGTPFTREAVLNGGSFRIPTKEELYKLGYRLNPDNAWNANTDGSSKDIYLWMPGSIGGTEVTELYEKGANVFYANWLSRQPDAIDAAADFIEEIGEVCEGMGTTKTFADLRYAWNNRFADILGEDLTYWLTGGRSDEYQVVLDMYAKYDYIIGKYGCGTEWDELHDVLGRGPNVNSSIRNFTPFGLLNSGDDNNITTVIVIVSSAVALLSITALSVLLVKKRKNKEQ